MRWTTGFSVWLCLVIGAGMLQGCNDEASDSEGAGDPNSISGEGVGTLPQDQVASVPVPVSGANLTQLTEEQAAYIGVKVEGPFKPDYYRY